MTMKQSIAIRHLLAWIYTGDKHAKDFKDSDTPELETNVQEVKIDLIKDEYLSGYLDRYSPKSYKLQLVFAFLEDIIEGN